MGGPPGGTLPLCPSRLSPAISAASTKVTPHPCATQTPQQAGSRSHKPAEKGGCGPGLGPSGDPLPQSDVRPGISLPPTTPLDWTPEVVAGSGWVGAGTEGQTGERTRTAEGPKAHQASQREEDSETDKWEPKGWTHKQLRAGSQTIKLQRDK